MITSCATESQNLWHLDSGCSKHMTGDPTKFITLKDNNGKITFGEKSFLQYREFTSETMSFPQYLVVNSCNLDGIEYVCAPLMIYE